MLNETLQGIAGTHGAFTHIVSQAHVAFKHTFKLAPKFIKQAPVFGKHIVKNGQAFRKIFTKGIIK
jgi:hypothetical protein